MGTLALPANLRIIATTLLKYLYERRVINTFIQKEEN